METMSTDKYMENIGIQIPSQYGRTSMDQLNVQWAWPPVPGMKITCRKRHDRVHLHKDKPKNRRETYVRVLYDIRPHKTETHRTRLTSRVNIIDYPGELSTPTSDLTTMKLHVNSTISDIKSIYIFMDVTYFYLKIGRYRRIHHDTDIHYTTRICGKYNFKGEFRNEYIYVQVTKGVYGIPQSRQIAHDALVNHLEPYGCLPSRKTLILWTHNIRPINFALVVGDYEVKCSGKHHALHLKAVL